VTLRLAIPKGRLEAPVLGLLADAGYPMSLASERDYRLRAPEGIAARRFKPRSIPELVDLGAMDLGFTGLDVTREAGGERAVPVVDLGLNRVQIVVATPVEKTGILDAPPRRPLVVATEYPDLAEAWMMARGLAHVVLHTHGSTEAYLPDLADVIVDCVETGATLAANGLTAVETLFESTTWAVADRELLARPSPEATRLLDALRRCVAPEAP
jgi:ATP phosphoribosyltransferase